MYPWWKGIYAGERGIVQTVIHKHRFGSMQKESYGGEGKREPKVVDVKALGAPKGEILKKCGG